MKQKILVIEDDEQIIGYIETVLRLNGFSIVIANNGMEGFRKACSELPDLIISDIMMPIMDGYEMLAQLRDDSCTAKIPVLLLSARSDKSDIRNGMNLGADDYLTKPFDIDDLLKAVNSLLIKTKTITKIYDDKIEEIKSNIRNTLPHEIRTPLNIILGYSNILIKKESYDNTEEIREMLHGINYGARRLHLLFENYLYYASLELISKSPTEVSLLIQNYTTSIESIIIENINHYAEKYKRPLDINYEIADTSIQMAENYFNKIIKELIDNAFKFSNENDKIIVKVISDDNIVTLSVRDNGRGMSRDDINKIGAYVQFNRNFYEQQGSGLGLTIVKKIAELHNLGFNIISEPNNFTEVIITMKNKHLGVV
jgi:two-component system, sensor histidine kinase and response regulator